MCRIRCRRFHRQLRVCWRVERCWKVCLFRLLFLSLLSVFTTLLPSVLCLLFPLVHLVGLKCGDEAQVSPKREERQSKPPTASHKQNVHTPTYAHSALNKHIQASASATQRPPRQRHSSSPSSKHPLAASPPSSSPTGSAQPWNQNAKCTAWPPIFSMTRPWYWIACPPHSPSRFVWRC